MGTYDTIGGTPRHNPMFDQDSEAECAELLRSAGHDDLATDPLAIDCEAECPLRNQCPLRQ